MIEVTAEDIESVLDLSSLENRLEGLKVSYREGDPYPHILLENFLDPEAYRRSVEEFKDLDNQNWNNYIHANERKFSHRDSTEWGPTLQSVLRELNSPRFVSFLGEMIGVKDLVCDPSLEGGGLHQSTNGGFLNIHADFTVHPHHRHWRRRANLLLYLNEDWKSEYGGDLELWAKEMSHCVEKVAPLGNRALIFTTDADSFHGHPEPMTCPEGVARRSLALYYFTIEENPEVRSTNYRARPGDGLHAIPIYLDRQLLRCYDWMKRRLGLSDELVSKLFRGKDRLTRRGDKH